MWKTSLVTAVLLAAAGTANAVNISTLSAITGEATPWGSLNTPIYGQTITFPETARLNRMEFRIDDKGVPISYNFYVYAWDGTSTAGEALFTSSGQTLGNSLFTDYAIEIRDTTLAAGTYVFLLEATSEGAARYSTADNGYTGGSWVYLTNSWYISTMSDIGFKVIYNETPG